MGKTVSELLFLASAEEIMEWGVYFKMKYEAQQEAIEEAKRNRD